jgi:hypothetical protein
MMSSTNDVIGSAMSAFSLPANNQLSGLLWSIVTLPAIFARAGQRRV